jgi:NADH-quinone oxidoreductase subunit M
MIAALALELLWLFPAAIGLLAGLARRPGDARRAALVGASGTLLLSVIVSLLAWRAPLDAHGGAALPAALAVDALTAVLLPLLAATTFAGIVASPRHDLDAGAARAALLGEAATLFALTTTNAAALVVAWALALLPLRSVAAARGDRPLASALGAASVASSLPLALGLGGASLLALRAGAADALDIATLSATSAGPWELPLGSLVLVGACIRMGVFPFHAWLPFALQRSPVAPAVAALVSPLGSFALVRLALGVFPAACAAAAPAVVVLGVASAAYGSLLAIGQSDLRRQLGYLLVSVAGFVLVGLASLNAQSISGALLHDAAFIIGCVGLLLIAAGIEARTGTTDVRRLGGLVSQMPRMATAFFLLAAAILGFPGTVTFVSEDLLVQGALRSNPWAAAVLLLVTAVNGVALLRSFKRAFLGPPNEGRLEPAPLDDLLPRERWILGALLASLLVGGFLPAPLLELREGVVAAVHRAGVLRRE